jgi:predicted nucleotidyltransferase
MGNMAGASSDPPALSLAAARRALTEALADESTVIAGYVFGSVAGGTAGPLSDLDIGLLIVSGSRGDEVCDRVWSHLCRQLRMPHVDVVSLAGAPMPLRYRVVRDGSLVVCRDAAALERFVAESVLHYLDFKPLRDRAFGLVRDGIIETR